MTISKYGHFGQKIHFFIDFIFRKQTFSKQAHDDKNFALLYAPITQFLADLALKMTIFDQILTKKMTKNRPKNKKIQKFVESSETSTIRRFRGRSIRPPNSSGKLKNPNVTP